MSYFIDSLFPVQENIHLIGSVYVSHGWFSTGVTLPAGDTWQCLGTGWDVTTRAMGSTDTPVIGARDASKHPTIHRTVCTLVKNVNHSDIEKFSPTRREGWKNGVC